MRITDPFAAIAQSANPTLMTAITVCLVVILEKGIGRNVISCSS
jgi:hypothetical protein